MSAFRNLFAKIRAINARYHEPRIVMSGAVRLSLLVLRVYLLALVARLALAVHFPDPAYPDSFYYVCLLYTSPSPRD